MRYKLLVLLLLIATPAYADIVSVDHVFVANDVYSADYHTRLNRDIVQLEDGINNIDDAQVKADTLKERSMADEINPRIRTNENACNGLVIDMLPVTTSGTLTSNTAPGTAYPYGYRVRKNAVTAHTYGATKWTWVFIDTLGNFSYTEGAVSSATPSTPANSVPIAKVVTNGSEITSVEDLRLSECSQLVLDQIKLSPYEPSLHNMLKNGIPISSAHTEHLGTTGWVQGLGVTIPSSGDKITVKSGSAWINTEYRVASSDIVVSQDQAVPGTGVSGICGSTAWTPSTVYNVYAVADYASQKTLSIVACPTTCSGCTNSRFLGSVKTSADKNIVLRSENTNAYSWDKREVISAWMNLDMSESVGKEIRKSWNIASVVNNGTGDFTVTMSMTFPRDMYIAVCNANASRICSVAHQTKSTFDLDVTDNGGSKQDATEVSFILVNDITF